MPRNITPCSPEASHDFSRRPRKPPAPTRLLLRLADAEGRVQGNQDDFGRLIGMTRSSVRRALDAIGREG